MEKLKVGDRVRIVNSRNYQGGGLDKGCIVTVHDTNDAYLHVNTEFSVFPYFFEYRDLELIDTPTESQSKKIKQALRKVCLSGLVIKSEKIISKVKQEIGTDYVFGDTILRALRQLRQDGDVYYTADKHTREYTFK